MNFIKNTIAITNRALVKGDYLNQIERVAKLKPHALILREKDLSDDEYCSLAVKVKQICDHYGVEMYVHSRLEIARKINCESIHTSVSALEALGGLQGLEGISSLSVACHSQEDVQIAIEKGATQIILGTIFETECKQGLKGKGLDFVRGIAKYCKEHSNVPVYAIGGIKPENIVDVMEAGAAGGCMMSYMMEL